MPYVAKLLHTSSGFDYSYATGTTGTRHVGDAGGHALLWTGTADSYVDLHPTGFEFSNASDVFENTQVGAGYDPLTGGHALLWNGTAESVVDLHASGYLHSDALGVWGGQQVGVGYTEPGFQGPRALLWNGSAASAVDLHPAGFEFSSAADVAGEYQVGSAGSADLGFHAVLWKGTAASVVDLHTFLAMLPIPMITSYAEAIAENGVIVGRGYDANYNFYAMMWLPVPEPSSCVLFACVLAAALVARRSRR